jgi:hypothetical protein
MATPIPIRTAVQVRTLAAGWGLLSSSSPGTTERTIVRAVLKSPMTVSTMASGRPPGTRITSGAFGVAFTASDMSKVMLISTYTVGHRSASPIGDRNGHLSQSQNTREGLSVRGIAEAAVALAAEGWRSTGFAVGTDEGAQRDHG